MIYNPTKIHFGEQAARQAADDLASLGSRAFIVTGRQSAVQSGALDSVLEVLRGKGISWQIHARIGENPSLEMVLEGAQALNASECDFVIGIGGGSPIDAAKAIALASANDLAESELYRTDLFKRSLPLAAVPTTSGTGTEVTQYSVLTDRSSKRKAGFGSNLAFPALAICDPRHTLSMGARETLNTGIDALSHLLEGIYSQKREALLYPLIYSGIKAIIRNLEKALAQPGNLAARSEMMRGALYGGLAISSTSTTLQHSLGYPLTSHFGVPHGLSNGIAMRQVMELYSRALEPELDELFHALGMGRQDFYAWLDGLGMKAELDITEEFIAMAVPEVMGSRNMANNPFAVSAEEVAELYRSLA
ncbi:MAG TPA: iron-containing alcohol dehydrogenase [Candidatus Cloacimonadota bacterium]|jgi:alcohol dehydrogenase class IV|nr:iron-containing alcohol dehydrogenase [Candidatus Cloacimonadota bacterium]HOG30593.1 iron-containing alcohol dehydrogenase [Candidatus Cloacimonadota bacterium]HOR58827.1 iron-containing alcohol dehydrogenase [Candidatus Cloacimonadota bacterium]HPB08291.1 iron-containing alcohol dehydrogenase [Candidatus Cloacimonadota bacterium]HPL23552.1 iron-containing alcohol dehydrogenase [Candidatus Cloacimonadota bacterium]